MRGILALLLSGLGLWVGGLLVGLPVLLLAQLFGADYSTAKDAFLLSGFLWVPPSIGYALRFWTMPRVQAPPKWALYKAGIPLPSYDS